MKNLYRDNPVKRVVGALKLAATLELGHAKSEDAHCLGCGFRMLGGADVGLCPKCGSNRWYRTRLLDTPADLETGAR
jgi:DNA-directed RNA polymerase subunit RPC12/RpoP